MVRMSAIDIELPAGCVTAAGPVGNHRLLPEEEACLQRVVAKRRRQFASGRHYAREAMNRLSGIDAPILRNENGRPIWPAGLIGSISHNERLAAAAVSNGPLRGVGIDVEDVHRIGNARPRLQRKLFTAPERSGIRADPRQGTVLFSAKEAAYKAINPLVGRYIGFQEVEAEIEWQQSTFRIRYLGEHRPNRLLNRGFGRFCLLGDQVVTLFFIE